jgi:N-methylhydantoinase A
VDVLPEIREYERTSTTVVNAYVGPLVKRYIGALSGGLEAAGVGGRLRIMQSNGGVMSADAAAEKPAYIVESGPAAGVVGAHKSALAAGLKNVISFDMGGTTAKASLIEDGERSWTAEYEVGAGIQLSSKLVKGRGHAVRLPVLDIAEVGAGGGSTVWVDRGGALKVGPQSAGASPGPACYGLGGESATVTDANVVLGYVSGERLAGGAVRVQADLARRAVERDAARPLGLGLLDAAYGVHTVANTTMIRALKAVSTYRGRDPREFSLLAFGGNGPVHAAGLAQALGITKVIVPPSPGLFSAVGMLGAEPERHFVQTAFARAEDVRDSWVEKGFRSVEARAVKEMKADGYAASTIVWKRQADLRYAGQGFELTVDAGGAGGRVSMIRALVGRFHAEHEKTYGHSAPGEPVEVVNLRVTARVAGGRSRTGQAAPAQAGGDTNKLADKRREAYFGREHGTVSTPVIPRAGLTAKPRKGPLIVEEYDATTVVPPGCAASFDACGNIVLSVPAGKS